MLRTLLFILLIGIPFVSYAQIDTLGIYDNNTAPAPTPVQTETIKISDSGLESELVYGSIDSQRYENGAKEVHLFGDAFVNYQDKELKADYIILNMEKNIAEARIAEGKKNPTKPTFTDAGKTYQYNRLKYNFETEKGIVYDAITKEGEFVIHGQRTKYVSAKSDTFNNEDVIYNANSVITTCNHDHPHFGFRAKKLKVVSEKVAVFGPSNLELGGVPTPIWLPFGFYPLTQGKSSGFIFPQNYEFYSPALGFGLQGFGWYFPFNDYMHLRLTADLYTGGTMGLYANTTYRKKYKYNGTIYLSFNRQVTEGVLTTENGPEVGKLARTGFTIRVNHTQDSKAHPFVNVGGTISIVGNNNQNRIFNDASNVLTNTYTSNFYYRHSMPGTPFNLSAGMNHNQNTQTGVVNITLPDVNLKMNTIYPFERKNKGSNEDKWYEKISLEYDFNMRSFVQTNDTLLFTSEMYQDMKSGVSHEIQTGFSTRLFKYFNFVPRASYEEVWVANTLDKTINRVVNENDTTALSFTEVLDEQTLSGFDSYRIYNAGFGFNTQLFGTKEFKKGWLRGIRHTMKPEIGYNYAPDTRSIYRDTLFYADGDRSPEVFTRFDNGPFNTPSFSDLQSQLTYRINNVLEIKYYSKKDSTIKKFKIFDNVNVSGNYNFAKDSIKWSRLSINTTSRFFKGITQLTSRWSFDPYMEQGNTAIQKTVWSERGRLFRLESGQIRLANRLTIKKLKELLGKKSDRDNNSNRNDSNSGGPPSEFGPPPDASASNENREKREKNLVSFSDILENISIDYNIQINFDATDNKVVSEMRTHSLALSGRIPLTENWNISIGNIGYDFVNKGLSYTALTFTRKLHCWDMNFSWFPNRDTYSFAIGVSSNTLSFLKYNYGQNNIDGLFNRF